MILQTLQDFLKVVNIFLELLHALQSPPSFRIFFYEFTNSPGLPEYLGPPDIPSVFEKYLRSLEYFVRLLQLWRKYLGPPGTPGVFEKNF